MHGSKQEQTHTILTYKKILPALLIIAFSSLILAGSFTTSVNQPASQKVETGDQNILINFSVNNKDPAHNITLVNVTLAGNTTYNANTNNTTATQADVDFFDATNNIWWNNTTVNGFVQSNTSENFAFNFSLDNVTNGTILTFQLNTTFTDFSFNDTHSLTLTAQDTQNPRVKAINSPADGTTHNNNLTLNATVVDRTLSTVQFNITNSTGSQSLLTASNSGADFWNATLDTTTLADGNYNMIVWANDTGANINNTQQVSFTIDNTGPTFTLLSPQNNANLSSANEFFNVTNVTDDLSSLATPAVTYAFGNSTANHTPAGSPGWDTLTQFNSTQYNETVDASGLNDGNYTLWFNASDNVGTDGNDRFQSLSVNIDYDAPKITTFHPPDNGNVSGTIDVNATAVDDGTAVTLFQYRWANSSGNQTNWISLLTSNHTFDTTSLAEGKYNLTFRANDTSGNLNSTDVNISNVLIDNTNPNVTEVQINDTFNATPLPREIFALNATFADASSKVEICSINVYQNDSAFSNDNPFATSNMTRGHFASDLANGTIDLTGHEGNFTTAVKCTDFAGNSHSNRTLNMSDNSLTNYINIDATGPHIVESSASPGNESFTNNNTPRISFNLTDFSEINESTIVVWFTNNTLTEQFSFDSSTDNFTDWQSYNSNETLFLEFQPNATLKEGVRYNVSVTANDTNNFQTKNDTFWFKTDYTAPSITQIDKFAANNNTDKLDRNSTTWYKDTAIIQTTCSAGSGAGISRYEITDSSTLDNSTSTSQSPVNLSISPTGEEKEYELDVICEDSAGNSQTNNTNISIDSKNPSASITKPSDLTVSRSSDNLPYDQEIKIEVTDNGIGFNTSQINGTIWKDLEFDNTNVLDYSLSLNSDNTTATITWTAEDLDVGKYEIDLNDVEDRFSHNTDLTKTLSVTETSTTDDTTSTKTGSKTATIEITDIDNAITLKRGETTTTDITVKNTGSKSATVSATANITEGSQDLTASLGTSSFSLDAGNTTTVTLTLTAGASFTNSSTVDVTFTYGSKSASDSITVNEDVSGASIEITDQPSELNILQGASTRLSFTATNTGTRDLEGLTASFSQHATGISPATFDLAQNASQNITVNISVSANASIGLFNHTLTVSNSIASTSAKVLFKIQPSDEETIQNITQTIENLEQQIEQVEDEHEKQRLQDLLAQARSALEDGDYATAFSVANKIKSDLQTTQPGEEEDGNLLITILIVGVVILVIAGLGAVAYFSIIPEEEESADGYVPQQPSRQTSEQDWVEEVKNKLKKWVKKIKNFFRELTETSEDEPDKKRGKKFKTRERKKIRFDEDW